MKSRAVDPFCALSYSRRTCLRRAASFLLLFFLLSGVLTVTLSSCTASPISIQKEPPEIKTQIFDKGLRPPEASPPEHNDCANTHFSYGFVPDVDWELVSRKRVDGGEEVVVKIKKMKLKLNMQVTMWLPEKASADVIAHERGHAAICIDAYKSADSYAKTGAEAFIGKDIHAFGADYQKTIHQALSDVIDEM